MSTSGTNWLLTTLFVGLIGFGIYQRYKRSFGRQPLRPRSMIARMALFAIVCGAFLFIEPTRESVLFGLGGVVLGLGLGWIAMRRTKVESGLEGMFYTPDRWIGVFVMALFFGRLAARMVAFYQTAAIASTGGPPFSGMQRSPFTTGVLLLMGTYYILYYALLLRKRRSLRDERSNHTHR